VAELLKVTDVSKHFAGLEVLKNVSFSVNAGEVVGLIGPNGAGKTTLFNIIAGALKPNGGKVFFGGTDITGSPSHRTARLGICRTFQIPQPFGEMTVEENVRAAALFSDSAGRGSLPKNSRDLLELVGLSAKAGQPASSLNVSGKKRLEVARALSTSPMLLMLDEFAAGLNISETQWATDMVGRLSKEYGVTIVWTEHVMRVLMRTVGRVLVLHQGSVIAEGSPDEIVKYQKVLDAYFGGKPK
jgi:branched-chain amino acid transport system ATP-binding protein